MKKALILGLLLFIFSCATTIKNFDSYQKAPLLKAEFMPNPDAIYTKIPSVIILPFQTEDYNAKSIGANAIVENTISSILISHKLVTIQDRKNLKKLNDEILLTELQNKTNSEIKSANFAIEGEVSNVGFSSEFRSARYSQDGSLISPQSYEYTATVQGAIKIYELPSLTVVDTIVFSGQASRTEEVKDGGISIGKFQLTQTERAKQFDVNLAKQAIQNAITRNAFRLKSIFAKTGYIMEKRSFEDKSIFLISLGLRDGIRQEDKLQIFQKYEDLNPLTGKTEILTRLIAVGTVADKTEETKTWVVIKPEDAKKIKLGDAAKVIYLK
jgi:PBP1b-binding outer membrane lipoprotein LpoB